MSFAIAERIADAVLYEGYVLYPYRVSAQKNRVRWQFGIIAPRVYSETTEADPWWAQTECLIEPQNGATLDVRVRFLQVQTRAVEAAMVGGFLPVARLVAGGRDIIGWDEGVARTRDLPPLAIDALLEAERIISIAAEPGVDVETLTAADGAVAGRVIRERWPIEASIRLSAQRVGRLVRVRLRLENDTDWPATESDRDRAMRRSLVSAHLLLRVSGGAFVSLLEPPDDAADAALACENLRTWPVLVGEAGQRDLMLSSPIILYDYPAIAPESPHDLCDGCEIDEILALRVMTLTDEEKREARATDDRARDIVDRTDAMPPDVLERLHGAIRPAPAAAAAPGLAEWETLLNPPGTPTPEQDTIEIAGVQVTKGSRVIVRPTRRADPIDMFMRDRVARVEGVYRDLEGATHVAVVLADDPSGDLHAWYGRFMYYGPEELEPVKENANA
jgi:hypothetical protein